jgi:hypothetical protein
LPLSSDPVHRKWSAISVSIGTQRNGVMAVLLSRARLPERDAARTPLLALVSWTIALQWLPNAALDRDRPYEHRQTAASGGQQPVSFPTRPV